MIKKDLKNLAKLKEKFEKRPKGKWGRTYCY